MIGRSEEPTRAGIRVWATASASLGPPTWSMARQSVRDDGLFAVYALRPCTALVRTSATRGAAQRVTANLSGQPQRATGLEPRR